MSWINCLQEYLQKNGKPLPKYDLVSHVTGINSNVFTIKVACENLVANGTALNKKLAKNLAAENMVKLLKNQNCFINCPLTNNLNSSGLNSSQNSPSVSSSLNNTPSIISSDSSMDISDVDSSVLDNPSSSTTNHVVFNSIGKLQELCVHHNLNVPEYFSDPSYTGSEQKYICKLGDMSEEAFGRNKKIAKQACAKQMWHRLSKLLEYKSEDFIPNSNNLHLKDVTLQLEKLKIDNTIDLSSSIEKAKKIYLESKTGDTLIMDSKKVPIQDYFSYFKRALTPDKLKQIDDYLNEEKLDTCKNYEKLSTIFNKICEILAVKPKEIVLNTMTKGTYAVSFSINTFPSCSVIGIDKNPQDARLKALKSILKTISTLLH